MKFENQNSKLRLLIAGLIVLSVIFFIIGQAVERGEKEVAEGEERAHDEISESQEEGSETQEGNLFGVNLESSLMISIFVLVWVVLIAILFLYYRTGLVSILIFAVITIIFDISEMSGKLGESSLLVFFVSLVTISHLAIAVLAVLGL